MPGLPLSFYNDALGNPEVLVSTEDYSMILSRTVANYGLEDIFDQYLKSNNVVDGMPKTNLYVKLAENVTDT